MLEALLIPGRFTAPPTVAFCAKDDKRGVRVGSSSAAELDPQLGAVAGELEPHFLAGHRDGFDHCRKSDASNQPALASAEAMNAEKPVSPLGEEMAGFDISRGLL